MRQMLGSCYRKGKAFVIAGRGTRRPIGADAGAANLPLGLDHRGDASDIARDGYPGHRKGTALHGQDGFHRDLDAHGGRDDLVSRPVHLVAASPNRLYAGHALLNPYRDRVGLRDVADQIDRASDGGISLYRKRVPLFLGMIVVYTFALTVSMVVDLIWFPGKGHNLYRGDREAGVSVQSSENRKIGQILS